VALGLADRAKSAKAVVWSASRRLLDAASLIYLDEYDPTRALQKLFDFPSDVTHEREMEKVGV
jgi:hypothetical protein